MEKFTLECAARWVQGALYGSADICIESVSTDSRHIEKNALFLPLVGDCFDGHDFIETALQNGAVAVLTQRDKVYDCPYIRVADTKQALLDLAAGYRMQMPARVIGVTGSAGKTTTKEMIAAVLEQRYNTLKTQGNLNNEIGLPQTVLRINQQHEVAVLEMGMNHFGEIARMTAVAKPHMIAITNIGTAHIEFLESRKGILQAKLEILEGLQAGGVAVLNGDEPLLWEKRGQLPCRTIYFGIDNPACDIVAQNIIKEDTSIHFEIKNQGLQTCCNFPIGEVMRVHICVAGQHNIRNALVAAVMGLELGEEPSDIARGLANFRAEGLRQNVRQEKGYTIFADCYNASPDTMEAALEAFSQLRCTGRYFAVLGSMLELGAYAKEGHMRAGRAVAKYADAAYLYGEGAQDMRQGALEQGMQAENIHLFDTRQALASALQVAAKPGDALLIKGSRGMKMEQVLQLFLGEE